MRSLTLFSAYEMVFMMNFLSAGDSLSHLSMALRRLATASASRSIRMASSFSSSAVYCRGQRGLSHLPSRLDKQACQAVREVRVDRFDLPSGVVL